MIRLLAIFTRPLFRLARGRETEAQRVNRIKRIAETAERKSYEAAGTSPFLAAVYSGFAEACRDALERHTGSRR